MSRASRERHEAQQGGLRADQGAAEQISARAATLAEQGALGHGAGLLPSAEQIESIKARLPIGLVAKEISEEEREQLRAEAEEFIRSHDPMKEYLRVQIFESIPTPKRGAPTSFLFSCEEPEKKDGGYRITRNSLGWVVIEFTPTGEIFEISPSNVKGLWHKPKPKVEEVAAP